MRFLCSSPNSLFGLFFLADLRMIIALLGAECTGKSSLAHALAVHLQSLGRDAVAVNEYLREWCEVHQRTPLQHEQLHIANTQQARIEAAAAQHSIVIADTTALMTAVYSEYVFNDASLYPAALVKQRAVAMTLVTGLDMPWQADGVQRDGAHVQQQVDQLLRKVLDAAQIPYQVVYGLGDARLLNAIDSIASCSAFTWARASKSSKKWVWVCDKCSDPECEHKLFSQLTALS
jgi:nicotinamide riboside kinase